MSDTETAILERAATVKREAEELRRLLADVGLTDAQMDAANVHLDRIMLAVIPLVG